MGQAIDSVNDWAGYFVTDIFASNYFTYSDRKLKTNIQPATNSLDKIMQLKTYTYNFRTSEFPGMALPTGTHTGIIADEFEQVYPTISKRK